MTVTTTDVLSGPYFPNGSVTVFPFSFKVFDASDLRVYLSSPSGDETNYDPASYSVAAGDESGSVIFAAAPSLSSSALYIALDPAFTNNISFGIEEDFFPQAHNEGFDRSALRDQVLNDGLSRSFKLPADQASRSAAVGSVPIVGPGGIPSITKLSLLGLGAVADSLGGATDIAPSQLAVQTALDAVAADALAYANFAHIYENPTIVIGATDQGPSIEGGGPTVMFTRSNDLGFLQISATARDKTAPAGGFQAGDALRVTGLPFTGNGIQPQMLQLEPNTGLPSDAYAALVGDTIGFYRPGRVPLTFDMIADTYFIRVGGIVAVLPPEATP